jgi:hypothetical protein
MHYNIHKANKQNQFKADNPSRNYFVFPSRKSHMKC